ncbi:MAG: hypothetical protein E6I61_01495 [Chloroflexi bacterium]|nr:MAG: hypothetical protein E6J08_02430 [Chloroflexota bacterium]TME02873.1 MAG: hypothetical protein E6I71_12005 [Chloroflexota bacterium]TME43034.1 MAG: hypothetical protein E6I61_01495 [Chloroflexota bacterium]TME52837.1 MAG: hypothetical protein E6I53_05240 [Chloroflexota bacterium]
MIPSLGQEQRRIWSIWAAAGIVAFGGLMPLVFGGTSSRVAGVIVPFWIAAIAIGACGLLRTQSRTVLSIIYFVAGLAIVYGLLSMFTLPIRLAVLGTCPALPAPCPTGLSRPLTDGENTGMGAAAALGIAALFLGFYGLMTIFRGAVIPQLARPVRKIPPVATPVAPTRAPEPAAVVARAASETEPELPAHEEAELPELPPHESSSAKT